jgi:hypothetical protein
MANLFEACRQNSPGMRFYTCHLPGRIMEFRSIKEIREKAHQIATSRRRKK